MEKALVRLLLLLWPVLRDGEEKVLWRVSDLRVEEEEGGGDEPCRDREVLRLEGEEEGLRDVSLFKLDGVPLPFELGVAAAEGLREIVSEDF